MQHSIRHHTRLSHFLTTIDETFNADLALEDQTPLADIWAQCQIPESQIKVLRELQGSWQLIDEDTNLIPNLPLVPGVYRYKEDQLVIVGWFDKAGDADGGVWHWLFRRSQH
jgi:hypothetical protein